MSEDKLDIVKFLTKLPGVNSIELDDQIICRAAYFGHVNIVQYLVRELGVSPTVQDNAPIYQAAENGKLDIVKFLLTCPEVNPTALDNRAIKSAYDNCHYSIVRLLATHPSIKATSDMLDGLQKMIASTKGVVESHYSFFKTTVLINALLIKDVSKHIFDQGVAELGRKPENPSYNTALI